MSVNLVKRFIEERAKIRADEELEAPEAFYLLLSGIDIYLTKEEDIFENVIDRKTYKLQYSPRTGDLQVFHIKPKDFGANFNTIIEEREYCIRELTDLFESFLPHDLDEYRYFLNDPKLPVRERIT